MTFKEFCINQHDVVCNQKYNKTLPYSFHLGMVAQQANKFSYILKDEVILKAQTHKSVNVCVNDILSDACFGHDLIEDARVTYNDIVQLAPYGNHYANVLLADIIYTCTEEKGKNRAERHSDEYLEAIGNNKLALFVKLCDLIANVHFSLMSNSSMYQKYQKEYHRFYTMVTEYGSFSQLQPMFEFLESLLFIHED
jgi:hypothetical protein